MIFRLGLYLAIGALLHLLFVGSHFDWSSVLTWLWLFGWPLMAVMWLGAIGVVCGLLGLACYGAVRVARG